MKKGYRVEGKIEKIMEKCILNCLDEELNGQVRKAFEDGVVSSEVLLMAVKWLNETENEAVSMMKILDEAKISHLSYRQHLSSTSKNILESQLVSGSEKRGRGLKGEMAILMDREVQTFLYSIFAIFGTGAAVFAAMRLFTNYPLEWCLIYCIISSSIITVAEFFYYIKQFS